MTATPEPASAAPWVFWLAGLFIAYTYALYPLLAAWRARRRPRPVARRAGYQPTVSAVVAARNEAGAIARRIDNLLDQDYPPDRLDVIVVSDGSSDATAEVIRGFAAREERVRAIVLDENRGKAAALNAAVAAARGEIIVFGDARQAFARDAVARLTENFADPAVGSASGELLLESEAGVATQVGLYWNYEKWIRQNESAAGSMLGATGAIYAIRRELWSPLPAGAILDDFLTPMRLVLMGWRAVFDGRALAWDRAAGKAAHEFQRKARTLAGNYQAFALEPDLLAPWRNRRTWLEIWSHKAFRLLVPYALILVYGSSLLAPGWFYTACALGQTVFYAAAGVGYAAERLGRPIRNWFVNLATTFAALNVAAVCGLGYWLEGRTTGQIWRRG